MPKISILVFVASPLDYARYRHAALYIQYDSPVHKSSLAEVIGTTGFYCYFERENYEIPVISTNVARVIPVSDLSIPSPKLREIVSKTPIPNTVLDDWNSQDWVGDVLGRLVQGGYLGESGRERAVDEMVSAVLEAGDEEV